MLRSTAYVPSHSGSIRCAAPHLLGRLALHSGKPNPPFRRRAPNMNVFSSKFAAEVFIPMPHNGYTVCTVSARDPFSQRNSIVWCDICAAPARVQLLCRTLIVTRSANPADTGAHLRRPCPRVKRSWCARACVHAEQMSSQLKFDKLYRT